MAQAWEGSGGAMLLSSTRSDVRLWHSFELGSFTPYGGMRHGTFHPLGQRFAAVASTGRQACIWDVNRADAPPWTLEDGGLANGQRPPIVPHALLNPAWLVSCVLL